MTLNSSWAQLPQIEEIRQKEKEKKSKGTAAAVRPYFFSLHEMERLVPLFNFVVPLPSLVVFKAGLDGPPSDVVY